MQLNTYLKDNLLLIIPSHLKEEVYKILDNETQLFNVHLTSFTEVQQRLFFSYKEEAYLYLRDKYNYNWDVIDKYLENLYYLLEFTSEPKLQKLLSLKEELEKEDLLNIDDLYKYYLKQKEVLVWGFDLLSNEEEMILKKIEEITKVTVILNNSGSYKLNKVYAFNDLDDEVEFVLNNIASLLNKGISPNHIFLTNVQKEYTYSLKKYFSLYHLPLNVDDNISLLETPLGKYFLDNYQDNFEETLEKVALTFDLKNDLNNNLYNKIVDLLNKTNITDKSYLTRLFSKTTIKEPLYNNAINIKNLEDNVFTDEDYVFVLAFNQGIIPKIYKDEDYLTDNLKEILHLDTTSKKNKKAKEKVLKSLSRIKNLTVTYKRNSLTESYYPSNLVKELQLEVIEDPALSPLISYSLEKDYLKLGMKLDNLLKYGTTDSDLALYYYSLPQDYQSFNNKYKQINPLKLRNYLQDKLILSYSSVNTFYKCKFRYYLEQILKLNLTSETFYTMLGNLYHYVLSKIYKEDFDFDRTVNNFLKDQNLSVKEKYFTQKLIKELSLIVQTILKQEEDVSLKKRLLEYKVEIDESFNDYDVKFKGFVDKIIYDDYNGQTIIAVVDYKTGNVSSDISNVIYGLDMQLPTYLYLIKYSNVFTNIRYVGFYLDQLLHSEITFDPKKDYFKQKEDNLRLKGYSNNDEEILSLFDRYYQDSNLIKSMKKTSNGFYKYTKLLNDEQIDNLISLTKKNIKVAANDIISADFTINPKRIGKVNEGCKYCPYQDICYRKEEDIVDLEEQTNLDYLN